MTAPGSKESHSILLHFHVCVHCGSAFRREVFEGRALTSGVLLCPKMRYRRTFERGDTRIGGIRDSNHRFGFFLEFTRLPSHHPGDHIQYA